MVTAVVQARLSSARLPGKVLREVAGETLLGYLLDRLARARRVGRIVVATSDQGDDDAVAAWCAACGVACRRGPLANVLQRFVEVATAEQAEAVLRVSGDSPLLDPAVVDAVVDLYEAQPCDLATNVFPRSFPRGQSAEVVRSGALATVLRETRDPEDLEHVTRAFYRDPGRWVIRNLAAPVDRSQVQLSVDTAEDLAAFAALRARMTDPPWSYGVDALLALRDNTKLP